MKIPRGLQRELKAIVGRDNLVIDRDLLALYGSDASTRNSAPDLAVIPANGDEAEQAVRIAVKNGVPVVPRGAGSGVCGGCVPIRGGMVVSLARMNRIIAIDPENHLARVSPGVINNELKLAAAEHGLFYPPDPASLKFCTLGGNVATGAGGPSAVKYGVTRDYVRALDCVLADGSRVGFGTACAKGVAGYDICRLLVGSEGTLALFTEITLALVPRPTAEAVFLLSTNSARGAADLVAPILRVTTPRALEFMDQTAVELVKDRLPLGLADQGAALLLIELDGDSETVAIQKRILNDFLRHRPEVKGLSEAATPEEAEELRAARRSLSAASFKLNPDKINEDVVVPRTKIPELVDFVHHTGRELAIPVFTFGHAGDGNLHVNIMIDKKNPRQREAGAEARKKLFRRVIAMGGTITGEHGVGLSKRKFLPEEIPPTGLGVMAGIKKAFDPGNLMNPGKIFPDSPPAV